jgi:serine/threonine-protein kinase
MGGVNLAVSTGPGNFKKLLVVKRLRAEIADKPEFLTMFLQEAKLSARLNHPNIVQTYEVGSDATSHFLTMEYLEGQSLQATLRAALGGRSSPVDSGGLSEPTPLGGGGRSERLSRAPRSLADVGNPERPLSIAPGSLAGVSKSERPLSIAPVSLAGVSKSERPPSIAPGSQVGGRISERPLSIVPRPLTGGSWSERPPSMPSDLEPSGRRRDATMPLPFFLRALCDAIAGLHNAHELRDHDGEPLHIVHRDVNPGNIFLTYSGEVKLLDFGIAKAADSSLNTSTGTLKGKVAYMAPEQLHQNPALDRRADIFALGVMLWEAATGQRLWRGVSDIEILTRLAKGQLPRPSEYASNVNPRLEAVCCKAMAVNPADRYATAAELGDELEAILDEIGQVSSRELGAYVAELFAAQRAAMSAFVRRKLDELRVAQGNDVPPPPRSQSEDSRLGPLPITISRPVARLRRTAPDRRAAVATLALAGGLAAASGLLWLRQHEEGSSRPATSVAALAVSSPAPLPRLHLRLSASPADARIFVDDVPLQINPYVAVIPADGSRHRVHVEVPGYVPQNKTIAFLGANQSFHFTLERGEGAGRSPDAEPQRPLHGALAPRRRPKWCSLAFDLSCSVSAFAQACLASGSFPSKRVTPGGAVAAARPSTLSPKRRCPDISRQQSKTNGGRPVSFLSGISWPSWAKAGRPSLQFQPLSPRSRPFCKPRRAT